MCSLFSKLGDLEKASQAFEVLASSDEGADEIAYSQMIHCYGSAGDFSCPLPLAQFLYFFLHNFNHGMSRS